MDENADCLQIISTIDAKQLMSIQFRSNPPLRLKSTWT